MPEVHHHYVILSQANLPDCLIVAEIASIYQL